MTGFRIEAGLDRGPPFQFTFEGQPIAAYRGESIAAALYAAGRRGFRTTAKTGEARSVYCAMGVCWECMVVIDGKPAMRACMTEARPGARVEIQAGVGPEPKG